MPWLDLLPLDRLLPASGRRYVACAVASERPLTWHGDASVSGRRTVQDHASKFVRAYGPGISILSLACTPGGLAMLTGMRWARAAGTCGSTPFDLMAEDAHPAATHDAATSCPYVLLVSSPNKLVWFAGVTHLSPRRAACEFDGSRVDCSETGVSPLLAAAATFLLQASPPACTLACRRLFATRMTFF